MLVAVKAAVLVPVKSFAEAKRRLAGVLTPHDRATLARAMATTVINAARPLPAFVVCDDAAVAQWAEAAGATVLWRPGLGLPGAVRSGVDALAEAGFDMAIVAHGDLPLATSLGWVAADALDTVTIVPDRHDDGTNVIALATAGPFEFGYGPGSFRRHEAEAHRHGLTVRVERDEALGWDVDLPVDLDRFERWEVPGWTYPANRA
jgi:2-phospho-L-lactate guanylyltransferase